MKVIMITFKNNRNRLHSKVIILTLKLKYSRLKISTLCTDLEALQWDLCTAMLSPYLQNWWSVLNKNIHNSTKHSNKTTIKVCSIHTK